MIGAISNNTTNEISIFRGVKKMTISELKKLSSNIQEFLNSQRVETSKSCDTEKLKIKSQQIFNSIGVNTLTSSELEQLRLKVQEILISHEVKFIKHSGVGSVGIKCQEIVTSHGLKKTSGKVNTVKKVFDSALVGEVLRVA
jgi:hypothetical protein